MENEKTINLTWLERFEIRFALLAKVDKLENVLDEAVNLDERSRKAVEQRINELLSLADKFSDGE